MTRQTEFTGYVARLSWRSLCLATLLSLLPLALATAASSTSFQLLDQTSAIGLKVSGSPGFRLESCVNTSPTGSGTSSSFQLQSGCITVLQAATNALPPILPPDPPGSLQIPIPSGSTWAFFLLALSLLFAAERYLGNRGGRPA